MGFAFMQFGFTKRTGQRIKIYIPSPNIISMVSSRKKRVIIKTTALGCQTLGIILDALINDIRLFLFVSISCAYWLIFYFYLFSSDVELSAKNSVWVNFLDGFLIFVWGIPVGFGIYMMRIGDFKLFWTSILGLVYMGLSLYEKFLKHNKSK